MAGDKIAKAKRKLRKEAGKKRKALHGEMGKAARKLIRDAGLDFLELEKPGSVSGFHPYGSEIDCRPLMHRLGKEGWLTCLPVVTGPAEPLIFREWKRDAPLEDGAWDIPAPPADAPEVRPDVLLVPLLAYDDKGFRLGYGGGFYDRTIELALSERKIITVGVAFSGQQVKDVPHSDHDQPLDWVLTELGPQRFA